MIELSPILDTQAHDHILILRQYGNCLQPHLIFQVVLWSRAKQNSKIAWKLNAKVKSWLGPEGSFEGATLVDTKTGVEEDISCDGAFIAIGHKPITGFLDGQVEMDQEGYILWKENSMTSVPGVFAGGDVVDTRYRQAITAAGMGCMAAIDAERWLEDNEH